MEAELYQGLSSHGLASPMSSLSVDLKARLFFDSTDSITKRPFAEVNVNTVTDLKRRRTAKLSLCDDFRTNKLFVDTTDLDEMPSGPSTAPNPASSPVSGNQSIAATAAEDCDVSFGTSVDSLRLQPHQQFQLTLELSTDSQSDVDQSPPPRIQRSYSFPHDKSTPEVVLKVAKADQSFGTPIKPTVKLNFESPEHLACDNPAKSIAHASPPCSPFHSPQKKSNPLKPKYSSTPDFRPNTSRCSGKNESRACFDFPTVTRSHESFSFSQPELEPPESPFVVNRNFDAEIKLPNATSSSLDSGNQSG